MRWLSPGRSSVRAFLFLESPCFIAAPPIIARASLLVSPMPFHEEPFTANLADVDIPSSADLLPLT
ncbi:MAG: hypothetical protein WCL50_07675 [Spirochaetota bacterium]